MQKSSSDSWNHIKPLQKTETCLLLLLIFGAYPVLHSLVCRVVLSPSCPSSLELGSAVKDRGVILLEAFLGKDRSAHHHWGEGEHGATLHAGKHSPEGLCQAGPLLRDKPNLIGSPVPGPLGATCRVGQPVHFHHWAKISWYCQKWQDLQINKN